MIHLFTHYLAPTTRAPARKAAAPKSVKLRSYSIRVLAAVALSKVLQPNAAHAFEAAPGLAMVDQGDDRVEPAAVLHLGWGDFVTSDAVYYGRLYGPVRQETYIVSLVRRWGIFGSNNATAHFGGVLMDERVVFKYSEDKYKALNKTKDSDNLGVNFGLGWDLPKTAAPLAFGIGWDSYIFAAGGEGGLFLATGRKHVVSLHSGVAF